MNRNIEEILNLKTNESIGQELADRQLEIIKKGFEYLSKKENSIFYIADEVGLGKTYIAAGIITLFRHFSKNPDIHRDVIIVPKSNLQDKWINDLDNFVTNNYKINNSVIKTLYKEDTILKSRVEPITDSMLSSIFRMTSFSYLISSSNKTKKEIYDNLLITFNNNALAETVLKKARTKGYFNIDKARELRHIVAYLLNALSTEVDCLVIDEVHNLKYGPGAGTEVQSQRNECLSRFLGAHKDDKLLNVFEELKPHVKLSLTKKIICLSATPKDRSLFEIKNQLSCLTFKHPLIKAKSAIDISSKLHTFLVRGNLEYFLGNKIYSRNQCRKEHREGNVNKEECNPKPLEIEDDFNNVFWQLLQYKSIKHLRQKNNASFEIGMLAGFESYQGDVQRKLERISDKKLSDEAVGESAKGEYEQISTRTIKESQDLEIITELITSYKDEFNEYPPHPKQTKLEDEIVKQLARQEKSLTFVRRVASASELQSRMIERYERDVVIAVLLNFIGEFKRFNTRGVENLISAYKDKKILEKLEERFEFLKSKTSIKKIILKNTDIAPKDYDSEAVNVLYNIYNNDLNQEFRDIVKDFISLDRKRVSSDFIQSISRAFKNLSKDGVEMEGAEEGENEEQKSNFFFLDYFKVIKKRPTTGGKFRNKFYRENWFKINWIQLNNHFHLFEYNVEFANQTLIDYQNNYVAKKNERKYAEFDRYEEILLEHFEQNASAADYTINHRVTSNIFETQTFLTTLLISCCNEELKIWLSKRKESNISDLIKDVKVLQKIIEGIFRNGSGLLAVYVAESSIKSEDEANTANLFNDELICLLSKNNSPFHFVLEEIKQVIKDFDLLVATNFRKKNLDHIGQIMQGLTPVMSASGRDSRDRGRIAAQFRMPGYPYALFTTDIFREGEDLHTYCQNIYHYGIAWNPSDMEQRTGRIDRINSMSYRKLNDFQIVNFDSKVHVFYPYLKDSVEVNQVLKLLNNVDAFTRTFNEIESDNHFESNVSIDEVYSQIPPQIEEKLYSKYDISNFEP